MDDDTLEIFRHHKVRITDYAFSKLNAYSRIVSSIIGSPSEVMGFLIGEPEDSSCTAVDAILRMDQNVEGARAYPDGNSFARAYADARRAGRLVVGMWHSHGMLENFHSADDDNHLLDILCNNTYYLKTRFSAGTVAVPYASSVVVNEKGYSRESCADPVKRVHYFSGIAFQGDKRPCIVGDLELEIVETEKPLEPDYVLAEQVCREVKYRGRYLSEVRAWSDGRLIVKVLWELACLFRRNGVAQ